tara:strand:- start:4839 stop:5270 length:432 start_codon:yes stop_codon:yes gene_type:complete
MLLKRRCHFVVGFAHASQVVHPLNVHFWRQGFVCPAHHDRQSLPLRAFATFPDCRRVGAIVVAAFLGFECFLGVIGRAVLAEVCTAGAAVVVERDVSGALRGVALAQVSGAFFATLRACAVVKAKLSESLNQKWRACLPQGVL